MINDKELMVAIQELSLDNLLELGEDGESFNLTDKGRGKGQEMLDRLPLKERVLLLTLAQERADEYLENVEDENGT